MRDGWVKGRLFGEQIRPVSNHVTTLAHPHSSAYPPFSTHTSERGDSPSSVQFSSVQFRRRSAELSTDNCLACPFAITTKRRHFYVPFAHSSSRYQLFMAPSLHPILKAAVLLRSSRPSYDFLRCDVSAGKMKSNFEKDLRRFDLIYPFFLRH